MRKGSDERLDERTKLELDELCVRSRRALIVECTHECRGKDWNIYKHAIILRAIEIQICNEIRHYLHFERIAERTDIKI